MHGVGTKWVQKSYEKFSHKPLLAVPSQAAPDPDFKTVKFPNPEEKGALLEAMKFANENNASLIVANDPDADRLAIAEKKHFEKNIASENDLVTSTGEKINNFDANNINNNNNINNIEEEWHIFSGNEIGVLLGYWSIMNYKEKVNNIHISNDNSNYNNNINNNNSQIRKTTLEIEKYPVAVLASVVSSRMLKKIAEVEGVQYFDTLTGFKWLGDCALKLRSNGVPVLFAYEEALGYCIGDIVVDKDGISAAAVFLEMAVKLEKKGFSIYNQLQFLNSTYGEFVSYNSYVICHDALKIDSIFTRLRTGGENGEYINFFENVKIKSIKDVTKGFDSTITNGVSLLPTTPDSHMIMYEFANDISVTLRTSGTEPKIKYYTEIAGKVGQKKNELTDLLHYFVDKVIIEMLQPTLNGLL